MQQLLELPYNERKNIALRVLNKIRTNERNSSIYGPERNGNEHTMLQ